MPIATGAADSFSDLDAYVGLPRVEGLWLSPDGRRLVVGVATPDRRGTRYVTGLWEVDPEGRRAARRLTRSAKGESEAAFTPSGDLLFVSARPEPDTEGDDEERKAFLWLLPAGGGEPRVVASMPGGVRGVVVARDAGTVALGSAMMPSSTDAESDREIRKRRREAKVTAILHEEYPVRFWDHDLGPDRTRLLVAALPEDLTSGDARLDLRDVTGHAGRAVHDEASWDIAPDGRTLVAEWTVAEPAASERSRRRGLAGRALGLRAALDLGLAAHPVRVALDGASPVEALPGPVEALGTSVEVPGWLEEVTATAADGTPVRAWLALPHGAAAEAPAPLLLWIHGGPLAPFNAWSWRPIGEGLRLWWDLTCRSTAEDGSSPHRFLYFPDENHWVLTLNHAKVWYSTVLAFLDHHVRGEAWTRPNLLD